MFGIKDNKYLSCDPSEPVIVTTPSLQELEQEKYHLRRRLESAQEEYEQKVNELHHDISQLQAQLDDHSTTTRQSEKEKSLLITTLSEQNQRLTTQLKEVSGGYQSLKSGLELDYE